MRKLLPTMLVFALFCSAQAGEVNGPPKAPPPPTCTENCTSSVTLSISDAVRVFTAELLTKLIQR